ncbi:MAG: CHAT domain-containing protein [Thermodesulfobacteriota bacterium]|nr:CHAT domain-containing protein [Thermodesulfobacteriota bacterium]
MSACLHKQPDRFFFHKKSLLIHQGLADLLLTLASRESKENVRQDLLREAQKVVEGIKLSKLRDYFRDPCLAALSKGIENLDPKTAVFYPIMLGDRLELLVEVNGELTCTTSFIQRDRLENEILQLARCLRRGLPFRERSQRVYDWLIKPVTPVLRSHNVDTLVIVPDGVLRLIPVGALMDGEHFLIEKYALVTVPGLTLLDPAPLGRYQNRTLLAGVSDPGPVIFDLPRHYWNALRIRGSDARGGDKGKSAVRGLSLETIDPYERKDSMHTENELLDDSQDDSAEHKKGSTYDADLVRQALKLPGVKKEIESLSQRMTGKVLFNKAFELEPFCSELQAGTYNILHIASHGFFGGEPEKNFIMTFDKRLDMNRLEMLIRPRQLADRPVEIVSLSACQTAEGDDRSPLGLTGVVLKSGARSALGSLWPVSDQAAQKLFPAFYALQGNSEDRNISKAEALRQAQLALMKQEGFRHPFYWSAFILVGNWL